MFSSSPRVLPSVLDSDEVRLDNMVMPLWGGVGKGGGGRRRRGDGTALQVAFAS